MTMTENELQDGRVVAIAGPVIDVEFPRGALPELNSAIEFTIELEGESTVVLAEVAQQLGNSRVRAICMKPTDGLVRGTPVRNTGHGIQVPVGDGVGDVSAERSKTAVGNGGHELFVDCRFVGGDQGERGSGKKFHGILDGDGFVF